MVVVKVVLILAEAGGDGDSGRDCEGDRRIEVIILSWVAMVVLRVILIIMMTMMIKNI